MFNLVDSATSLGSDALKANPNQHGAADMVADDTRFAGLALGNAGQLFGLAMKLLNGRAPIPHFLCCWRPVLRLVVSDDEGIGGALGGEREPKEFHLMSGRETVHMN